MTDEMIKAEGRTHRRRQLAQWILAGITLGCVVGCGRNSEPPLSLGRGDSGGLARRTKLTDMNQKDNTVTYSVEYAGQGLASSAKLDFLTAAVLEETFSGKWVVIYQYDDMRNKALKLPNRIAIHKYGSEAVPTGEKIADYTLSGMPQNGMATYATPAGRKRQIDLGYFDIAPGPVGGASPFR